MINLLRQSINADKFPKEKILRTIHSRILKCRKKVDQSLIHKKDTKHFYRKLLPNLFSKIKAQNNNL